MLRSIHVPALVLYLFFVSLLHCGKSLPPPPQTADGIAMKTQLAELLEKGYRNFYNPTALDEARKYIASHWIDLGGQVTLHSYDVHAQKVHNVVLQVGPTDGPQIIVGAHYDVADDLPGADDNGSGTVGLMLLGKKLIADKDKLTKGIRVVAFTLEEQPFYRTPYMGSEAYAQSLRAAGTQVQFMLNFEMIGYFSTRPGSQEFPEKLTANGLPNVGNFICLIGREQERALVDSLMELMKPNSSIPLVPLIADPRVPGISASDHNSFWENDFLAVMLTDTAFFRNPNYHKKSDTLETLHFDHMAALIETVHHALLSLAGEGSQNL